MSSPHPSYVIIAVSSPHPSYVIIAVSSPHPSYVIKIDSGKNKVYVGSEENLYTNYLLTLQASAQKFSGAAEIADQALNTDKRGGHVAGCPGHEHL